MMTKFRVSPTPRSPRSGDNQFTDYNCRSPVVLDKGKGHSISLADLTLTGGMRSRAAQGT